MTDGASTEIRWDWSNVSEQALLEILRQGEERLGDLLTVSVAADQRATTLSGIFGGLAAGLVAADATLRTIAGIDGYMLISIAIMATMLLIASALCGYAARPIDFYVRGYEPSKLVNSGSDYTWMLRYLCQDADRCIAFNKNAVSRTASLTTWAFYVAMASIVVAALAFILSETLTSRSSLSNRAVAEAVVEEVEAGAVGAREPASKAWDQGAFSIHPPVTAGDYSNFWMITRTNSTKLLESLSICNRPNGCTSRLGAPHSLQ